MGESYLNNRSNLKSVHKIEQKMPGHLSALAVKGSRCEAQKQSFLSQNGPISL